MGLLWRAIIRTPFMLSLGRQALLFLSNYHGIQAMKPFPKTSKMLPPGAMGDMCGCILS